MPESIKPLDFEENKKYFVYDQEKKEEQELTYNRYYEIYYATIKTNTIVHMFWNKLNETIFIDEKEIKKYTIQEAYETELFPLK
jgi:hypothetical protein